MNTLSLMFNDRVYPRLYCRILICLIVSHFLVSFGEAESFFELIKLRYYYPALGGSFMIAMVIGEFIYFVNRYLDKYFSWRKKNTKRLVFQILVGVFFALVLAVFMAMLYFKFNHTTLLDSGYFKYDFTVIACFIALLNAYYVIIGLYQVKLIKGKNISNTRRITSTNVEQGVAAIIFSELKHCYVLQFDGQKFGWYQTLKESIHSLPATDYFLINRSEIVHRLIIARYEPSESKTLKLFMKSPFEHKHFYVSQRNVVAFKRWLEMRE